MLTKINRIGKDGKPLPGRYRFDALINGVRYRKQVFAQNKMQAQFMYEKWRSQLVMGDRAYMFFEKLDEYQSFSKAHKSPRMYDTEKRHIMLFKKHMKDMPLTGFRRQHAEDYIALRKLGRIIGTAPLNTATINRDLSTLRFFFGWCIQREYYTGNNPVYKLHRPEKENERVVWLTYEQKRIMYEQADDFQRLFLNVALLTGMRQMEIATLRWEQVDMQNGLIQLFKTKSKRPRTIRIPKALIDYLSDLRNKEPFSVNVITRDGRPVDIWVLERSWCTLRRTLPFRATNGTQLRFHDLRHAYACDALMQGMSKEELQVQLGHTTVLMVEKYARYIGNIPREKVDGMRMPTISKEGKMA